MPRFFMSRIATGGNFPETDIAYIPLLNRSVKKIKYMYTSFHDGQKHCKQKSLTYLFFATWPPSYPQDS